MVTSEQPRSPVSGQRGRGGVPEQATLEVAEQQTMLIHEEYKKLLREKEVHTCLYTVECTLYVHVYMHVN